MNIKSKYIYMPHGCISAIMQVVDGKIVDFLPYNSDVIVDVDVSDNWVIPGIIDTHNHGTMGYTLMGNVGDKEKEIRGYLKGLASQGVTACLPTADYELFSTIVQVAKTEIDGTLPIGIHSEGPYLNRVGEKGVDTGHPDIDLNHIQDMIDKAQGMLKLVAIAPELAGAKEAIELLNANGVRCAFAHSNANYQEALDSFKWGISVITHTANVMEGIHHRRMGGLGAALLSDDVYNELICDGLHVSNEMIELMLRVKNDSFNKFIMISDNVPMAGAPIGKYHLPGMFDVNIDDKGYCLSDTGRLCGSTVPVIGGMKNLFYNVGISMKNIIRMSSENPAKVYGAVNKGSLQVGKDADFVIIDPDFKVIKTYREGKCIYDNVKETKLFNSDFLKLCGIA